MKVISKKKILSCITLILLIFVYTVLNYTTFFEVKTSSKSVDTKNMEFLLGGDAVGIKLLATGVLVMGIDRDDTNLKIGDIILSVNGNSIDTNTKLLEYAKNSNGDSIELKINRQNEIINESIKPLVDSITGEYKLGLWVKDSSAGVGTITFYEKNNLYFAGLGHGVTETKENYILPITSGAITFTNIYSLKKGEVQNPGELKGTITQEFLGDIITNTTRGIYGKITKNNLLQDKKEIQIMRKNDIKEGKASIVCTLDNNEKKEYEIYIQKVLTTSNTNKNMVIKITDEALLSKTGGIIQGMSGSPIIQDGKLVGAVTHVFLNDPTRGYGVFIENMIEDMEKME